MTRLATFLLLVLIGTNGYTFYEKATAGAVFKKRETELEKVQTKLEAKARALEQQADTLRAEISLLERRLADTRVSVGKLRRKSGLERRLHGSYPQLAQTDWGVIEIYDERNKRYAEYMVVPLWMSETFIIDHTNAGLYQDCLRRRR